MIRDILREEIKKALKEIGVEFAETDINLEHPTDIKMGDYSTNVAMMLAKKSGGNPKELAEKITEKILAAGNAHIADVRVAGPGFINFYLSPRFFTKNLQEIMQTGDDYGQNKILSGKKVMVEYTDPNPFKEFHIGHLMSNTIGEALSRVIESSGAETRRACYQGDVGLHVAKAIWGYLHDEKKDNLTASDWGTFYAAGAQAYEKDESAKTEINELNQKIYKRSDDEINKIYDAGRKISLAYFETIYQKLGTKFDYYFFESETGLVGKQVVEEGLAKGVFEKSDGAIIFRGEKYDSTLHTRVFINSLGLPTYEAKDLGLAKIKYDKYPYDLSVSVTGSEIVEYFKVVLAAMKESLPELAAKIKHVSHGMLRLPTGKMSSRTGEVVTTKSLINEVKTKILTKIAEKELLAEEKDKIAEAVAVSAIKYSILKQATSRDVIFDFDKSLSFEGDSGPYLQYTYTRANSVLTKAGAKEISSEIGGPKEISPVEKLLYQFPEVLERAYQDLAPHHLVSYLVELAGAFNSYYAKNKIIGSDEESYRLTLTKSVATVLKNGLNILAIPILERM